MSKPLAVALALLACLLAPAQAAERSVTLANAQGERVRIGSLDLQAAGEGAWRFRLKLDVDKFEERFLAMRPFRCLTGPRQQICHFPFGEDDRITRDDLRALEYQLMFLHKPPAKVSVDSRDGIYYRLAWQGEGLIGTLFDVDMNPIVVPGDGDPLRPIEYDMLQPADPGSHWLPQLIIE